MAADISVNTQNSIRIAGSATVYFDPLDIKNETHDADWIFITHSHYDHFSPDDIIKIAKDGTRIVCPASMQQNAAALSKVLAENVIFVRPGDRHDCNDGIAFSAVPAYNIQKPFHPKDNSWCGYVLCMDGEKYYIAGDTDALPENRGIECGWAFIPVGGKYTMDSEEAAGFVNALRPRIAVPVHYGSIVGKKEDGAAFRNLVSRSTEVRILLGKH